MCIIAHFHACVWCCGHCLLWTVQPGLSEEQVCERQRAAMKGLPEFGVKDMASWFRFVVLTRPTLLQGLQVSCVCVCVCVCVYVCVCVCVCGE